MRLPQVLCLERAEGTAVFPAGQLSCLLRPPGSPSGQILRPVDGRTALPILPGLTSPARKSCARQATAESETTCAALWRVHSAPLGTLLYRQARPEAPPTSEQRQAGGSKKRELACASAQCCRYTAFPARPICFGAEICIMPRKQQKTDRPEPVRLFISLTFSVAGIFYSVNRVCRNTQIFRRTSSCPAWTMSPGWA